ncbi:MAG: FecR family protein [Verrucomicrobiae bacterium]|nr:FecR family protein [Verrucomicrobiae bacterium]
MKNRRNLEIFLWRGLLAAALLPAAGLQAAPLKTATVTQMNNEVKIAKDGSQERAAEVKDRVEGKDVLRTGRKSRAELEFADKSLARLGSNTIFSFDPASRQMNLQRGSALIHVPPGLSGAKIVTPAATAGILGDVVAMRVNGKGVTQIVALSKDEQGPIEVKFNKTGEKCILQPGQLLTVDPMDVKMPQPITINVDVFVQSSQLVNGQGLEKKELPVTAIKEVRQAQEIQSREIQKGNFEGVTRIAQDNASASSVNNTFQAAEMSSVMVQAATGSQIAGHYVGNTYGYGGCSVVGNLVMDLRPDGSMSGTRTDSYGAETLVGSFSSGGTVNVVNQEGTVFSGTYTSSSSTISGQVTSSKPNDGGTFTMTKQ